MSAAAAGAGFELRETKTGKAVSLAMQHLHLSGEVLPFGARLLVCHRFVSEAAKNLEVVYTFALPRDAALRRFRAEGEGFSVASELKPAEEAAEEYEKGIAAGSLSALARTYADGLVNLSLGNLRPGEAATVWLEIMAGVACRDDGLRFRFPFTLAPSYHPRGAWTLSGGSFEGELPQDEFGDVLLPPLQQDAGGLHQVSFDLAVASRGDVQSISSPSHPLSVGRDAQGRPRIQLAVAKEAPNRDLVLDVRWEPGPAVFVQTGPDGQTHFAALAPSTAFGEAEPRPRRVVLLLDRSGSMQGAPLEQARKAAAACLAALDAQDQFGLLAFDDEVESCASSLAGATTENRASARRFLEGIDARGGTELASGVEAAARLLGAAGGEVFILTDGQVFGTGAILARVRATGVRLHVLGIGSASQDRLLASLARETGGVERFVTPRERVDLAAVDLFASASAPVAEQVRATLEGGVLSPEPARRVFAGQPWVAFGEFAGAAPGSLVIHAPRATVALPLANAVVHDAVIPLRGARLITDTENRLEEASGPRDRPRVQRALRALSERFGLASQAMALVAVIKREGDVPGGLPVTQVVPLGLPQDMEPMPAAAPLAAAKSGLTSGMRFGGPPRPLARLRRKSREVTQALFSLAEEASEPMRPGPAKFVPDLVELAGRLEPDGGMPGRTTEERVARTLLALAAFAEGGHTASEGVFRVHVRRMQAYLRSGVLDGLTEEQRRLAETVLASPPPGQGWLTEAWNAMSLEAAPRLWETCRRLRAP